MATIFPTHVLTNEVCQLACVREFDVKTWWQLVYANHGHVIDTQTMAKPNQMASKR